MIDDDTVAIGTVRSAQRVLTSIVANGRAAVWASQVRGAGGPAMATNSDAIKTVLKSKQVIEIY
jgi:hypothetical protein